MNYKVILSGSLLILGSLLQLSCEKEVTERDIDSEIQQLVEAHNLPSLSAVIFNEEDILWKKHIGYADQGSNIEADEETVYHIGSISKLFIVTALMQLEEEGKLDPDEDINAYLPVVFRHPGYPDVPITCRMLLTHTAGLSWPKSYDPFNGMWDPFEPDQGPPPSEWVPEFLIPGGMHYDAALWKNIRPGEYEFYSNIGACVAAYVVEQLSGMNIRAYCREHIFDRLDMHNTSYDYADLDGEKIAIMYDRQGKPTSWFDNRVYASGGAKSTVHDLSHFAMCYLNKGMYHGVHMLSEGSIDNMLEVQNPSSGKCLMWNKYAGDWYGHSGGLDMGTTTVLAIHPGSRTGFIIFTNTPTGLVDAGGEIYWLVRQKTNEFMD
jgi:CubicO group peptidase (beta-lactamase class C family)